MQVRLAAMLLGVGAGLFAVRTLYAQQVQNEEISTNSDKISVNNDGISTNSDEISTKTEEIRITDPSSPGKKVVASPQRVASESPHGGVGIHVLSPNYTPEEIAELEALGETVKRFTKGALAYREATQDIIQYKFKRKRDGVYNVYEQMINVLEKEQRARRGDAIAKFEAFIRNFPKDEIYSSDAMFRLSELYFERSYDNYFQKRKEYDEAIDAWDPDADAPEPLEPDVHYEPTIAMMQRLIIEFPQYHLIDGAYYLLGYCLGEQGEEERAVDVYLELVEKIPNSHFAAEVWTRVGEFYFNSNDLERALAAYTHVVGQVDSPFYDKALYKLAWTHYRMADPELAPDEFQAAVDTFVALLDFNEQSKAEGKERGGDLRNESVQYIAISYADEEWGGTEKMLAHFDAMGNKPYIRDIMAALGDVYYDQTRYDASVSILETLQQRYPKHPKAPLIQEKIITAHERNRNFEAAAKARGVLTQNFNESSPWWQENEDNPDDQANAKRLTEQSLYSAALFHHKQAQIHKEAGKIDLAKQAYGRGADAYGGYLKRFPHDKQLYKLTFYYAECLYYSLQFDEAAVQYMLVRDTEGETKFLEDAAFSAVLAFENAVKVAVADGRLPDVRPRTSTERDGAPVEPKEIPPLRTRLIAGGDRLAELVPSSDKLPNVLYKSAEVFYGYDHFDEARRRFLEILKRYPKHEVAQFASNLMIESYLTEQDFASVEQFTAHLLERPDVAGKRDFRNDLVKFRSGAMFKMADDLAMAQKHVAAAQLYMKLLDENPDTEFGDSAMNNAAVAYEKAKRYDSASKLYERLVARYPKSLLADSALFRVGLNAERFFDFDKAILSYNQLVKKYKKSQRRADAIYNMALSLDNTQQYERSASAYLRYCKLFADREDAPTVCFKAGEVYEKMNDPKRVVSTYKNFIAKYRSRPTNRDRIVEAYLRIAKAYGALKKPRDAKKYFAKTVKEFARSKDPKGAPYAAEAQFQLIESQLKIFTGIRFTGKSKQQQKTLVRKAKRLKKVEQAYKEILKFKQIDWTLASLFRIGQLYQQFAESLIDAECPSDVKRAARKMGAPVAEVCDEYRVLLEDKAAGLEDKAVAAYETTIHKAREFQVVNAWTKLTLGALNRLRRKQWPLQKDAKFFIDASTTSAPPLVDSAGKWLLPHPQEPTVSETKVAPQPQDPAIQPPPEPTKPESQTEVPAP